MLKEIISETEELFRTKTNVEVNRYKGEFESQNDIPLLPEILFQVTGIEAGIKTSSGETLAWNLKVKLYAAETKNINERNTLDLIESINEIFDEVNFINIDETKYQINIQAENWTIFGYIKGVEIYTIEMDINFNLIG